MSAQPKLTPTFNDIGQLPGVAALLSPQAKRIEEAHEPISDGSYILPSWAEQKKVPGVTKVEITEGAAAPAPLKVALIGTAPSSKMLAPFNDPSWKIWACSPGNMNQLPRVDAWFEIHSNLLWPEHRNYGEPYVEWLKKQTFPVYMQDQSLVPNALTFPADKLVAEFGRYFFTSSFAWMIAFAITQGAKEIALFGIDMASREEYILQRPGGHYFMEAAAKRGIKVSLPSESDLLQPPALYGYGDSQPFSRKMQVRRLELQHRVAQMKTERDKLATNITYLEGALEDNEYILSIWSGVGTHL